MNLTADVQRLITDAVIRCVFDPSLRTLRRIQAAGLLVDMDRANGLNDRTKAERADRAIVRRARQILWG